MSDRMTPEQRHKCMSHIRSKNTKPELKVRQWLWRHGYRYRLNVRDVPGKPDIVLRKYRTAIFVNGCFWHGHEVEFKIQNPKFKIEDSLCCRIPNTNRDFWVNKIRRNQERDQRNYELLRDNGWQVLVVWECQLKPSSFEHTMCQIEFQLHDFYLKTFDRRSTTYIHVDEDLPMVAEDVAEYRIEEDL